MFKNPRIAPFRLLAALVCLCCLSAGANPQGLVVRRGTATANLVGSVLNLQVSGNAVLNWSSFNIGRGETTTFSQPNSHSVVWNNIGGSSPSQIFGNLNANGYVVLMNPNGFYFGGQSVINAKGFVATSSPIVHEAGDGGMFWSFDGAPPTASIINYGTINAGVNGSVYLIADAVENHGTITAPDGKIGLYAGKDVKISERPDGLGLTATVRLPAGSVDNTGKLIADAGTIMMNASVVNQDGLVQANSVRNDHGRIELIASDEINLGAGSTISATGGSGVSAGGVVEIKSGQTFSDVAGSVVNVDGGAAGGNGGKVNLCANVMDAIASDIRSVAQAGWIGGELYIDPTSIILGNTGTGTVGSGGTVGYQSGSGTLRLNVNTAFTGFSHIDLQASQDITLSASTVWNLNASTGVSSPGSTLTLEAGRNIIFGNGASLTGGQGWSVEMVAGRNFSAALSPVPATPTQIPGFSGITLGTGGIYINGGAPFNGNYVRQSGSLETMDGSIDLRAGNEVVVGSGYVRSDGGGNVSVEAGTGNVDAGNNKNGYIFTFNGAQPNLSGVGGIATQSGGDVTINAGNQILSTSATVGCYAAGDVNLTAGGSILGTYQVANGHGVINAPQIGSPSSPISLSLADGSWTATAVHGLGGTLGDIYVNEVFNPNGSLNSNPSGPSKTPFYFTYAPDASVTMTAGNSIQLLGTSIFHTGSDPALPPIYPPELTLTAGAGGVVLGNDVVLYPSAQAALNITTTHGGSLVGANGNLYRLIMSDSDSLDYTTFINGHSTTPLQMPYASQPVEINVAGNIEDVSLQIPKRAVINVGGDAINFYYTGQNLLPGDVTTLNVTGNIINQTAFSEVTVPAAPNLSIFDAAITTDPLLNIGGQLSYNAATHQLIFRGQMTVDQLNFMLNPTVFVFDKFGNPVIDPHTGLQLTQTATFESAALIQQLYTASLQAPKFPTTGGGLICGGPGTFNISANSIDLGTTAGIRSVLTGLNPALALLYTHGADININTLNNLDVTSSQIASFNDGSININAGGKVDVGSASTLTTDDTPKGIYTAGGGAVTVTAVGDVSLNGSRIATYAGGDVNITSTTGNVDAGNGGSGFFYVTTQQLNSKGQLALQTDKFFGSGILTLTSPGTHAQVGNITVTAAKNISANSGGILQLAFSHSDNNQATVTLHAGGNINAGQSGVLGENLALKAGGTINGLIIAHQNLTLKASGDISVTAVANGSATVSSGGTVSGSITGGGAVSVTGSTITGEVISTGGSTSTSGDASHASVGAFQGVASTSAQKTTEDADQTVAQAPSTALDNTDDQTKKKTPKLAKATGRVRIILPQP